MSFSVEAAACPGRIRRQYRELSLVDQTKFVTAASELGRNTVIHGGGGEVIIEVLTSGNKRGIRLTFQGQGAKEFPTSNARCRTADSTTGSGLED